MSRKCLNVFTDFSATWTAGVSCPSPSSPPRPLSILASQCEHCPGRPELLRGSGRTRFPSPFPTLALHSQDQIGVSILTFSWWNIHFCHINWITSTSSFITTAPLLLWGIDLLPTTSLTYSAILTTETSVNTLEFFTSSSTSRALSLTIAPAIWWNLEKSQSRWPHLSKEAY